MRYGQVMKNNKKERVMSGRQACGVDGRWFRSHRTILSFLEYAYEDELNKISTYIPKG